MASPAAIGDNTVMKTSVLSRRRLIVAAAATLAAPRAEAAPSPVTVELFTSQGCSSCPPADALFGELTQMPGVIGLAWHVDYWDYLGWKDTLGSTAFSQRQYDYAKSRGDMDVYTPQIIVNGATHVVGSDRAAVMNAIAQAQTQPAQVPLTLKPAGNELLVDIGEGPQTVDATLWVMGIGESQRVKVLKGENAGRDIAYRNTVRTAMPAGMWKGSATTIRLPRDGVMTADCSSCTVLLQRDKVGPVLGVAHWDSPSG